MHNIYICLVFILLLNGCNEKITTIDSLRQSSGTVALSFDQPPPNVSHVIARLSRRAFEDKILNLSLSDSQSASGTIPNVEVGLWHLRVDALNDSGRVLYTGETDVNVLSGLTTVVTLQLQGTTGTLEIYVTWGNTTCAPVTDGLISWWRGDGNSIDIHNGYNGLFENSQAKAAYVGGMVGNGFHFDGIDDRMMIPDVDNLKITGSLTIEAWIYLESFPIGYAAGQILMRGDARPGLDPYMYAILPSGNLLFSIQALDASVGIQAPITVGQYFHVAAVLDSASGVMRVYINGSVAAETSTSIRPFRDLDSSYSPGIGVGNTPVPGSMHNHPFHGIIDELAIYNRALSSHEIRSIYLSSSSGKCK